MNHGGRVQFALGAAVRILNQDGKISECVYIIDLERSDRNGCITVKREGTLQVTRVHHRRVIQTAIDGQAVAITSAGKTRAVCPSCSYVEQIVSSTEFLNCPTHGQATIFWLGDKPMSDETPEANTPTTKPTRELVHVDLNKLAGLQNCELYTQTNVKFDQPRLKVHAHTLLYTGENPRKFCFNTYDGTTGKNGKSLPFEQFVNDQPVEGAKKDRPWYKVADLDKARQKLKSDGYELHSPQ